jgi:glycosyltransferase involved in cell wall biosynthesis
MKIENSLKKNTNDIAIDAPLVSVLMPLYCPDLEQLKISINSLDNQTLKAFELVIIDDTPDNQEIKSLLRAYKKLNINYHHNKKKIGLSKSLNYGLSLCTSDYIARADCDDHYHQTRLEVQLNFLKKNLDIDLCGSNCIRIDNEGKIIGVRPFPEFDKMIKSNIQIRNPIAHPSVMARKSFFNDLNGYSESTNVEDYELWFRAKQINKKFYNIQSNLCYLRVLNENESTRKRHWFENLTLKLKYFDAKNILSSIAGVMIFTIISILPQGISSFLDRAKNRII